MWRCSWPAVAAVLLLSGCSYPERGRVPEEEEGGAAEIYVLDMSDTSRPLSHYGRMLPDYCEDIGVTSFGSYDVLMTEVANGFFYNGGGKITLK